MNIYLVQGGSASDREKKAFELLGAGEGTDENDPDFFLLTDESSIGIDAVRGLQKKLKNKPYYQQKKVYLRDAEKLTPEAQNALLKTLEEPPERTTVVLTTESVESLLPTVRSRCQITTLGPNDQGPNQEKLEEVGHFWSGLSSRSVAQRLLALEKTDWLKDRPAALEFLELSVYYFRQQLHARPAKEPVLNTLKKLLIARRYLMANANIRLVLETLLLDLRVGSC